MIKELLGISDFKGLMDFGVSLLKSGKTLELQASLKESGIVFSQDDFWSKDKLNRSVVNAKKIEKVLRQTEDEELVLCTLHRLQLLSACCPATEDAVKDILSRCSI